MQLTVAIKVHVIYFYNWLTKYYCLNSQVVTSASRRFHEPLLGQNAISLVLPQTPGKKEQISSTERMLTLCVLLGAKQKLTLLSATLEQSTQSCFSCHIMMLCDLLLLIQCTFFSLVWPKQPWRFGRRRIIKDKHFDLLQRRVDAVIPPPEIGRIPSKISTGLTWFTADQWKNWVCYYSAFA